MNLHDEIMKLKRESYPHNLNREDVLMAYRMGYRDARADAAKLALEQPSQQVCEKCKTTTCISF